MKKRIGAAFSCAANDSSSELEEVSIYNVFPDIRDPRRRGYYLPVIDAVYLPIIYHYQLMNPQVHSRALHETTHAIVADTLVSCKLRELAFLFTGMALDFIMETDEPGYRLLVPSFRMVGPQEEDDGLAKIAAEYDELYAATEVIHEIVAHTVEVEAEGYSRAKVMESITDYLQDDRLLNAFLDVYEQIGPSGACALASHVLNTAELLEWSRQDGLARAKVLERFQQVLRSVRGFKKDYPREGSDLDRLSSCLSFYEYLNENLPGYNHGRCPLAGACLGDHLRSVGQFVVQHSTSLGVPPRAGHIFQGGADVMGYMQCDYQGLEFGKQPLPDITIEALRSILVDKPVVTERAGLETRQSYVWPLFNLFLNKDQGYTTVGLDHRRLDNAFRERGIGKPRLDPSSVLGVLALEAQRQQWWRAEGPRCFCYPLQVEDCHIKTTLAEVWKRTARDHAWEESENWKSEDPPECIKDII
jgi:hypothetical protein